VIGDVLRVEKRPLALAMVLGVLAAGGLAALALALGSWAYHHRRFTLHDGRLQRLVEQTPPLDAVTEALLKEPGNRAIPVPASDAALRALAAEWSAARADEVLAKKRRWPTIRIFGAGEMVYFLYFDDGGLLRDYVLFDN
jgi:hypothetical protein